MILRYPTWVIRWTKDLRIRIQNKKLEMESSVDLVKYEVLARHTDEKHPAGSLRIRAGIQKGQNHKLGC